MKFSIQFSYLDAARRGSFRSQTGDFQVMVGNGDVYNTDGQRIVDGTEASSQTTTEISTTLTITDVSFSTKFNNFN